MFFILASGRRNKNTTAADLDELGEKVTKLMANQANDGITVAIGKTDKRVMPFVVIQRNPATDKWQGELGDSIKLGIEDGLLEELEPIQMMDIDEAIASGFISIEESKPKKTQKKRSDQELHSEAKKMIDNLFKSLK